MEDKTPESQQEPKTQKETSKVTSVPEPTKVEKPDEVSAEDAGEVPEEEPEPLVLEEMLAESRQETEKTRDLYMRARADLENYRKRAQREKEELARFGNENILRELLPVLDNLERAVEHAQVESSETEVLLQGVEMTISQFQKALDKFGASTFSALGEPFDPARHEAMGQIETDDYPPNTVVQELQKGCLLNDRLLRPAMVMVARTPEKKTSADIEND